jgi:hypothetical protein
MALPRAVKKRLKEKFKPPKDVLDCYKNWAKWRQRFSKHKGLLLLQIGLKFPSVRQDFYKNLATAEARTAAERVYKALAMTANRMQSPTAYGALREDIDDIKGQPHLKVV